MIITFIISPWLPVGASSQARETRTLTPKMLLLLLLPPMLWAGSQAQSPGYKLQVQESVTVQKSLCVFVPCTVSYPQEGWTESDPVYGHWFQERTDTDHGKPVATSKQDRQVQKSGGQFYLVGDPQNYTCSLLIKHAQVTDTGRYFFRVERGPRVRYNYNKNLLYVNVTEKGQAQTRTPDIHIQGTLEAGHPKNITCTVSWDCVGETLPIFSWIGVNPAFLGARTASYSVVTLTPWPQDHNTNLTCRVTFPGTNVSTEKTIQLNVSYALQNLTISRSQEKGTGSEALSNGSSLSVQEGEALYLVCKADSNPPTKTWWTRGSLTLNLSRSGVLELPRVELEDRGKYVCQAQQESAFLKVSLNLHVKDALQLLGPSCSWEDEGLSCTCSSRAQPPSSLHWWLGEGLLEGNYSNTSYTVTSSSEGPWVNSSLSLRKGLTSNLRLRCEAQNSHGEQTVTVLLLPGRPGHRTGVIQGVVGGAGVTALLAICLGLIIARIYRKKGAENQEGISQSHLKEPSSNHLAPVAVASAPDNELHYAALSFHNMKPHNPQAQEATTYSEIKIQK